MLKKITVFKCDTCKRSIELELDERRPYPLRCTITNKCPGIYKKINEKNSRSSLIPPVVFGLEDYIPRGSVNTVAPITVADPLVSLLSGNRQLVLAATKKKTIQNLQGTYDNWATESDYGGVAGAYVNDDPVFLFANDVYNPALTGQPTHPYQDHVLLLELYELAVNSTSYSEYYYVRKEGLTQISGQDDSLQRAVLRFEGGDNRNDTNKDNITVTVNGIEVPRIGSAEAIATGKYFMSMVTESGERAIKFVPSLTETSNAIKIYVYQRPVVLSDPDKVKTLVFRGLQDGDVKRTTNAWGDIAHIDINYQISPNGLIDRYLFTCTNLETTAASSELQTNNRYLVKSVKAIKSNGTVVPLDPTDVHLLIGQAPYSYVDKVTDLTLNLKEAIDQNNSIVLQYYQDEFGNDNLYTEQSNLADLVQHINILEYVDTSVIPNTGSEKVNQADTLISSKYIVGYV